MSKNIQYEKSYWEGNEGNQEQKYNVFRFCRDLDKGIKQESQNVILY